MADSSWSDIALEALSAIVVDLVRRDHQTSPDYWPRQIEDLDKTILDAGRGPAVEVLRVQRDVLARSVGAPTRYT